MSSLLESLDHETFAIICGNLTVPTKIGALSRLSQTTKRAFQPAKCCQNDKLLLNFLVNNKPIVADLLDINVHGPFAMHDQLQQLRWAKYVSELNNHTY
jgi:hypothetical protein